MQVAQMLIALSTIFFSSIDSGASPDRIYATICTNLVVRAARSIFFILLERNTLVKVIMKPMCLWSKTLSFDSELIRARS